ncbi:MAG: nucleotidyltransferase domain-containing protein, partial [Patescibacteria group bacterium]
MGLYLYGSLVWGDFDREISDIDLLAVTSTGINNKEFDALKIMHDEFVVTHKEWEDRIEVAYVSQQALKTFKDRNSQIAVVSQGEPFHFKDAG